MMNGRHMSNKQWPHPPEALLRGRLVYSVKFYGDQEVQQAKGTEPIKEAVRKMKFNKQLRKAEGHKVTPKVELCINVDGIAIQEPKTKVQQYKFPLHHISYCADDKSEKKLFTFIAKDGTTGKHHCFVLGSEKNAEEITLTIGQAFDLAYKRFLEKKESQMEKEKQFLSLQQQVQSLQEENRNLKKRIAELEAEKSYNSALGKSLSFDSSNSTQMKQPITNEPDVGTKLQGLLFTDDFSPSTIGTTSTSTTATSAGPQLNGIYPPSTAIYATVQPKLAPPPKSSPRTAAQTAPATTGFTPSLPAAPTAGHGFTDEFGMTAFNPSEMADMEHGFKGGLMIGIEDFDLNSLDPLK